MNRPRFLFNVPRSTPERLLELERATGEPFSTEAAVCDLHLHADAGRVRGQRTYAKRWGWTYPATRYHWPELTAEAARRATADGRQLDGPGGRKVPVAWLLAAGYLTPNSAETGPDNAATADPQRTREDGAEQQRTRQRTNSAPDSAENRPDATGKGDLQRTEQRADSAPDSAHLPSLIPHPPSLQEPTDPTNPARERTGGDASPVGRSVDEDGLDRRPPAVVATAAAVARLREAGETAPDLDDKVSALVKSHGAELVGRQLDGLTRQYAKEGKPYWQGARSPYRLLLRAVENPDNYGFPEPPRPASTAAPVPPGFGTSRTPEEAAALDAAGVTTRGQWIERPEDDRLDFVPLDSVRPAPAEAPHAPANAAPPAGPAPEAPTLPPVPTGARSGEPTPAAVLFNLPRFSP